MVDDKRKGLDALNEIGARLGDLFGNVRTALDEVAKAAAQAAEKGSQSDAEAGRAEAGGQDVTIETPAGPIHAKAGWSVRVGGLAGGADAGDDFSSDPIKKRAEKAAAPAMRDCRAEVFEEEDAWIMTAELPGVREDELSVTVGDGVLRFATTGDRRFAHQAPVADGFDTAKIETRLANGILEIRIPKAQ